MRQTQDQVDPKQTAQPELDFAAFIGIDWADAEHAICLFEAGGTQPSHDALEQSPEAIEQWANALRERFGGRKVALCIEQSKGALIYALMKYDFFVIYPVNPKQLARYRDALAPSGAKDDPDDAWLLLDLLLKHRERLRPWKPDDEQTRLISQLAEDRRGAVDLRTGLVNALKARLKQYFPQALVLGGEDHSSRLCCDFLLKYPTLEAAQKAKRHTLRKFYYGHHCRNAETIQKRLELLATAMPLTRDTAVIQSAVMRVQLLAKQVLDLNEAIKKYENRLAELMDQHQDGDLFRCLPGAGAAMAPRLLAAFGSDRERYDKAFQVGQYSGIAPVTRKSGKSKQVRRRYACPKFLRQTFHEFAAQSIKFSKWARAYYDMRRAKGDKHHAAVRSLAFKWIRIMFACWKTRTRYDEATYLARLVAKKSPLLEYLTV